MGFTFRQQRVALCGQINKELPQGVFKIIEAKNKGYHEFDEVMTLYIHSHILLKMNINVVKQEKKPMIKLIKQL